MDGKIGFNNPNLDIGMQIGSEIGRNYLASTNLGEIFSFSFLKPYFCINNKYVLRKIKQIIFPFLYKEPEIQEEDDYEDNLFQMSRSKIEYPDMYLPLVSFMTYVLLVTFNAAISSETNTFSPDYLGIKSSKNMLIIVLHMIVLKTCKFLSF